MADTIKIIVGLVGGVGILAFLFGKYGNIIPGFNKQLKETTDEVVGAEAEVMESELTEEEITTIKKETDNEKFIKRSRQRLFNILKKFSSGAIIIICSAQLFAAEISKEELAFIKQYTKTLETYVNLAEQELRDLLLQTRKDTTVEVIKVEDDIIIVRLTTPIKRIKLNKDGVTLEDGTNLRQTIKITPHLKSRFPRRGLFMPMDLNIFMGGYVGGVNAGFAIEMLTWQNYYMRCSMAPYVGVNQFGLSLYFGPAEQLSNGRIYIGAGKEYLDNNENITVAAGFAAAIRW